MTQPSLDFVSGFLDSDGSLQLILNKEAENRIGFTPKLYIDITNTDKPALDHVKALLGMGFVQKGYNVFPEKQKWCYRITSHKGCHQAINMLQPHLRGAAAQQSVIFEAAANLAMSGATREKAGLAQYIHLMYLINSKGDLRKKSLGDWLHDIGADTVLFDSSLIAKQIPMGSCSDNYIAGYTQGDGSFYITNVKEKQIRFGFTLIDGYKPILESVQKALDCGSIYTIDPGTSDTNKLVYRYQIDTQTVLRDKVIRLFDRNLLVGRQQQRYLLWREGLFLQQGKVGDYKERVKEVQEKLKGI